MQVDEIHRAELGSIEITPDGASLVLGLVDADQQRMHLQLPSWTVHQLMRVLPRLDAALTADDADNLIAHAARQWSVQSLGAEGTVALCVQTDQRVEAAYSFRLADAIALHAALGEAISARSVRSAA